MDLAKIYGYSTKDFNRQVKNNIEKFEQDFMFQLTDEECEILRCKNSTSSWGGRRYNPYAFTEQGIYMLMTVLKGELATKQSKALIRIFKQMKDYIVDNQPLLGQREYLQLSLQTTQNTQDLLDLRKSLSAVDDKVASIIDTLGNVVTKSELANVMLEKNVTTRRIRKRLTIYDKGKEMNKADNIKFMKTNGLSNEYNGKCRFEMNLTTQEQIRNTLHIEDTKLKSVLSSTNNPIVDFLNEAVGQTKETISCSEWKSYQRYLVLKDCDFDLAKVEAKVRSLYKRGTKIADVMKPYRDAYDSLCFVKDDFFSGLIRQLN